MSIYSRPPSGNVGKGWKEDEITQLLKEIKEKKLIEEIAALHKRNPQCIKTKLKSLASKYYLSDNKPFDEIHELTGVKKEDIIVKPPAKIKEEVKEVEDKEESLSAYSTCKLAAIPVVEMIIACAVLVRFKLST